MFCNYKCSFWQIASKVRTDPVSTSESLTSFTHDNDNVRERQKPGKKERRKGNTREESCSLSLSLSPSRLAHKRIRANQPHSSSACTELALRALVVVVVVVVVVDEGEERPRLAWEQPTPPPQNFSTKIFGGECGARNRSSSRSFED